MTEGKPRFCLNTSGLDATQGLTFIYAYSLLSDPVSIDNV